MPHHKTLYPSLPLSMSCSPVSSSYTGSHLLLLLFYGCLLCGGRLLWLWLWAMLLPGLWRLLDRSSVWGWGRGLIWVRSRWGRDCLLMCLSRACLHSLCAQQLQLLLFWHMATNFLRQSDWKWWHWATWDRVMLLLHLEPLYMMMQLLLLGAH